MNILKHFYKIYLLTIILSTALIYANDIFYADIYVEGSNKTKLAFTHKNEVKHIADKTILTHFYYTPNGSLHVKEEVVLLKGQPFSNTLESYGVNEYAKMEFRDSKVDISFRHDDMKKSVTRRVKTPLVFGPSQQNMLNEHFDEILNGEAINVYALASEFLKMVKLKVQRIKGSQYEQPGTMVLEMRPRSTVINWFVGKTYYVVDIQSGRVLEMHGFSTLRQKIDGKWEYVNMDFYYTYE